MKGGGWAGGPGGDGQWPGRWGCLTISMQYGDDISLFPCEERGLGFVGEWPRWRCKQYGNNNWQRGLGNCCRSTSMSSQDATHCRATLPACLKHWTLNGRPPGKSASDQHDGDLAGPVTKPGELKAPNSKQQPSPRVGTIHRSRRSVRLPAGKWSCRLHPRGASSQDIGRREAKAGLVRSRAERGLMAKADQSLGTGGAHRQSIFRASSPHLRAAECRWKAS